MLIPPITFRCCRPPLIRLLRLLCVLCLTVLTAGPARPAEPLRIGSKRFTESYLLGEILTQTAARQGPALHRQGLGNTAILFEALKSGAIDLYPEYTGTIEREILKLSGPAPPERIRAELARLGLGMAVPLGFNNSYAIAVRGDLARERDLRKLSDLAGQQALRLGLSHEFFGRADGWPGLARHYRLAQTPSTLDHGLAYEALAAGQIDAMDIYTTDAKIGRYGLRVLEDDRGYFPRYDAVLLYRLDVEQRFPQAWRALRELEGQIREADMIAMNAAAELDGMPFAAAAGRYLDQRQGQPRAAAGQDVRAGWRARLFGDDFWRLTRQHAMLVLISVGLATLAGIPLGILAAYFAPLRQVVMAAVGLLQTVPALALFAMLIPLLGRIGAAPALIALFLYALLPITRNTCIGIGQVSAGLRMAALALGMRPLDRLLHIDLPLAQPVILAGVKTAAVISVGTATIAAFIGAGGYGERIAIGLAVNDNAMLLAGAIPAAALALLTQAAFELLEWRLRRRRR